MMIFLGGQKGSATTALGSSAHPPLRGAARAGPVWGDWDW